MMVSQPGDRDGGGPVHPLIVTAVARSLQACLFVFAAATAGSTRALRAGGIPCVGSWRRQRAARMTPMKVIGSAALTCRAIPGETASPPARRAIADAESRTTRPRARRRRCRRTMSRDDAPSAARMPISRVRSATAVTRSRRRRRPPSSAAPPRRIPRAASSRTGAAPTDCATRSAERGDLIDRDVAGHSTRSRRRASLAASTSDRRRIGRPSSETNR